MRVGAQGFTGWRCSARHALQAEHLLPGARPKRDAVSAGGRLQRRARMIGLDLPQVGHPLFFDKMTLAGQPLQDAGEDLRQQGLQFYGGGCTRFMKHRCALAAAIEAVEHQAVETNIQVGGGAKALDEGDGAGVGFAAFDSRLLEQHKRKLLSAAARRTRA